MRGISSCSPAPLTAGSRPKITPVSNDVHSAKLKTRPSISKLWRKEPKEIPWIGLSVARIGTSQLQIGEVRATNQQEKADPSHQGEERLIDVAFNVAEQLLPKRDNPDAPTTA